MGPIITQELGMHFERKNLFITVLFSPSLIDYKADIL